MWLLPCSPFLFPTRAKVTVSLNAAALGAKGFMVDSSVGVVTAVSNVIGNGTVVLQASTIGTALGLDVANVTQLVSSASANVTQLGTQAATSVSVSFIVTPRSGAGPNDGDLLGQLTGLVPQGSTVRLQRMTGSCTLSCGAQLHPSTRARLHHSHWATCRIM